MSLMLRPTRGRAFLFFAALGLVSVPLAVCPAFAETLNMAGVKVEVIERKLDNGLTILMVENHQS
ncbi:MAG: hypothetical protein FD129_2796, partial [bacterium]